jgi:hypothetical protein
VGEMVDWKEGDPLPMLTFKTIYSEEGKAIDKAIMSASFWRSTNEIIIGVIAFLTIMFFVLIGITNADIPLRGVSLLISMVHSLLIISGVVSLVILEYKVFEKLLRKILPLAY